MYLRDCSRDPLIWVQDAPPVWQIPSGQKPPPTTAPLGLGKTFNTALSRAYHLKTLTSVLLDAGMTSAEYITGASTPIVKFSDPTGLKECDLSVNDLGGW